MLGIALNCGIIKHIVHQPAQAPTADTSRTDLIQGILLAPNSTREVELMDLDRWNQRLILLSVTQKRLGAVPVPLAVQGVEAVHVLAWVQDGVVAAGQSGPSGSTMMRRYQEAPDPK